MIYETWVSRISTGDGWGHTNFPGLPIEHIHGADEAEYHFHSHHMTYEGMITYCWANVPAEDIARADELTQRIADNQSSLIANSRILSTISRQNQGKIRQTCQRAWRQVVEKNDDHRYF